MSATFSVQKALDGVLKPALDALSPPVPLFDHAPDGQAMPFVVFSRVTGTPDNLVEQKMLRVEVTLTVFSAFRGSEECQTLLGVIDDTLDDAELTLDSGQSVRCDLVRSDVVVDADGVTRIGSGIYAVLVAP